MKKVISLFLILFLCVLNISYYAQSSSIKHNGITRTYLLHVPSSYSGASNVPLVIALHNAYGSATSFQSTTLFNNKSDAEGFIVVYPDGTGSPSSWNGGGCCLSASLNNIDDVGFVSVLIDTIQEKYKIDPNKIFAFGFSNGAILAYRIAAELSNKIAAIGAVAGPMMVGVSQSINPVPIVHFHAKDDIAVPYNGGYASGLDFPAVESTLNIWKDINGCKSEADTIYNQSGVLGKKWQALTSSADIELYLRNTGGHTWPNNDVCARDIIWDFFRSHPKNGTTSVINTYDRDIINDFLLEQNFPNPFNPITVINYKLAKGSHVIIKVSDILGKEIITLVNEYKNAGFYEIEFNASKLASGVYIYSINTKNFFQSRKMVVNK